jgi:uncharacterized protein (DUF362 family)
MSRPKVILRRCPDYDAARIENIIREGIEELGLGSRIRGRVTIKPNVVMAHPKVTPAAFTRAGFMDGLVSVLKRTGQISRLAIAEKCGAAIPTSRMFRRAGYYRLKRKHGIRLEPIEEARKKTVVLQKGVIHKSLRTARSIADRDFLVYAPKLKTNSLSQGLTAALKLNIGILCDRERMWQHNYNLDEKIVDLLEVGYPDLIATDAIEISTGGNHLTQHGRPLGLILISDNPLAHDVVCAHILHLDPKSIGHLALAAARGYGALELADIEITGDISLDALRRKTEGWETGYIRVDEADCGIKTLCGEPYCRGGCHGVFLDWLYMIKDRKPKLWARLPSWTAVIGKYRGDVAADRLLVIGDCTEVDGHVRAKKVRKIRGCPPKHKSLVLWIFLKTGILNPLFRLDLIYDAYVCLFFSWVRRLARGRL